MIVLDEIKKEIESATGAKYAERNIKNGVEYSLIIPKKFEDETNEKSLNLFNENIKIEYKENLEEGTIYIFKMER